MKNRFSDIGITYTILPRETKTMKSFHRLLSCVVFAGLCFGMSVVQAKDEAHQQDYERCATAMAQIVRQRNELRVMLKGLEKELKGAKENIAGELQDRDTVVAKVKVLIDKIKSYNSLLDSIGELIPIENEQDLQKATQAFVDKHNKVSKEKDELKKEMTSKKKELKKTKTDLKKKIEAYEELCRLFNELVEYAVANQD